MRRVQVAPGAPAGFRDVEVWGDPDGVLAWAQDAREGLLPDQPGEAVSATLPRPYGRGVAMRVRFRVDPRPEPAPATRPRVAIAATPYRRPWPVSQRTLTKVGLAVGGVVLLVVALCAAGRAVLSAGGQAASGVERWASANQAPLTFVAGVAVVAGVLWLVYPRQPRVRGGGGGGCPGVVQHCPGCPGCRGGHRS